MPGLRRELATELIRSLPKAVRTSFVPAPDFAAKALGYAFVPKAADQKNEAGKPEVDAAVAAARAALHEARTAMNNAVFANLSMVVIRVRGRLRLRLRCGFCV